MRSVRLKNLESKALPLGDCPLVVNYIGNDKYDLSGYESGEGPIVNGARLQEMVDALEPLEPGLPKVIIVTYAEDDQLIAPDEDTCIR